jgi:hypothetical protein
MFYQLPLENVLRFGDVVQGYILAFPEVADSLENKEFKININSNDLCVVLTPCCSIRDVINLVPLKKLTSDLFTNPFLVEDITRINRKMTQFEAMKASRRERLTPEAMKEAMESPKDYQWKSRFVYEENARFKDYDIVMPNKIVHKVNSYWIDFKDVHKTRCTFVKSPEVFPYESKLLQLTVDTRRELMDKLHEYYRIPDEDFER